MRLRRSRQAQTGSVVPCQAGGPAHVQLSAVGAQHEEESQRTPDRLIVRTLPVDDPGDLIARLPYPAALAWIRRGEGLVGWGVAARVILPAGEDRFTAGEKWLRELFDGAAVTDDVAVPGSGPVAFGSFTFDPTSDGSVLVIPRVVLGRAAGSAWLTTITDSGGPMPPAVSVTAPAGVLWSDGSLTAPQWEQAVAAAVTRIRAGSLRKVVLARDLRAEAWQDLDARVLLARLAARYPDCYTFSCAGLVGATPELLIRRDGDQVRSLVLAGTTPRGASSAADDALGATLLASAKNVEEHEYAVADVRASLQPLCDDLDVEPQPSLLRLANLQHLAGRRAGRQPVRPCPRGRPAPDRRSRRHADARGDGADPRAGGHGPGPLRGAGRLGRCPRQWRMGHRAAVRRA